MRHETHANRHRSLLRGAALAALFSVALVPSIQAQTAPAPRLFLNSDGSVHGVLAPEGGALFTPGGDVLASFKQWVRSQTSLLRLAPMSDDSPLIGIARERETVTSGGPILLHPFVQTYRGYPVVGPAERIRLLADSQGRVLTYAGTVVDAGVEYAGLDRRIGESAAASAILAAWEAANPSGQPGVGETLLVAVPERRTLGYRGEILSDEQVVGAVTVSAVDGAVLGIDNLRHESAFVHKPVNVLAYQMVNNPATTAVTSFFNQPGSTFGAGCLPAPPSIGCTLRMGNERAAVYDFEQSNNTAPTIWTTIEFQPHPNQLIPWGWFSENNDTTFRFKTQNVFQKMAAALAVGDAAKGGAGWDHHPNAPFGLFTAPPVSVFTNIDSSPEGNEPDTCDGALGWASFLTFNNTWAPVEHPFISNTFSSAAIALCSQDESVLFHELGHYYDMHSTFNALGTGLASNTCHWDTTDESLPLRETVADLTALYFSRKLYPAMPFDVSTTPTPCSFSSLGRGTSAIHGGACTPAVNGVGNFQVDRPSASNINACNYNNGYRIRSIQQATWEYLWGKNCATTSPFRCSSVTADPDSFMTALLLAESVSNFQSYEQFFEMMTLALWVEEGLPTADRFRDIFSHHNIIDP